MAASVAQRFLPAAPTAVSWKEFKLLAERHGLVQEHDEVGARHLLADLLSRGEVRAVGTYPCVSVVRPAVPEPPEFHSTEDPVSPEAMLQTNANLRRENARLRRRLEPPPAPPRAVTTAEAQEKALRELARDTR